MQIKELRLNIQFEYIKEIRKYIYDIEDFLIQNNLCDKSNQVPPIPDDIEPHIDRLNIIKTLEDKNINIAISQADISILFSYKIDIQFNDKIKQEVEYITKIAKNIKDLLIEKYPAFIINYEGLVMASSKQILKDDEIFKEKHNINLLTIEDRKKIVNEIDSKHTKMVEKSLIGFYNNPKSNINHMAIKKNRDNLLGWDYILVIEINNRSEYNNAQDENISRPLDFDFAYSKIKEFFNKETN